ncbi:DUF5058 family protein [Gracilibacillus caseinilyticus]|uniref:DUF5058 family protein n=1 Tax=Gracilibacillus caseinilyticus TaxID=2932256 RepID=A0ABY4EZS9_9BACI|nr:DUF5058 family protein [Gracilibacillus caseinilyticus]UOQ49368.1 DUF5058 family protein [Gracilibacillus caseinilyticus]
MEVLNDIGVWLFALAIAGVVIFQGIIFIRIAMRTASSAEMTLTEAKSALKTGAITALGPSLGIMIVVVSLISILGSPLTLMRIGIIGSAPMESMGASIAAQSFGVELGSSEFSEMAFTTVAWALCLGGMGWLLVTALFTKSFGKVHKKVAMKVKNPGTMIIFSSAAMLGAFGYFVGGEMIKGMTNTAVVFASAVSMVILSLLANKLQLNWLKEWSLGFSIIVSLSVCYFLI